MDSLDIFIRYSGWNSPNKLAKATTLQTEGNLVYRDDGDLLKAHVVTTIKFSTLTLFSPFVLLARTVRAVAFASQGQYDRAGREFLGGVATPFLAAGCLLGSLYCSVVTLIGSGDLSFYHSMRKIYAHFEAWTNGIDLHDPHLPTFSHRVSKPFQVFGTSHGAYKHVWTTAPCMQPILERGKSSRGGLLDVERMRKVFPLIKINSISEEHGRIVIQSEYPEHGIHRESCGGACEQARISTNVLCCFNIEAAYDRVLCCEVGQANCSTVCSPSDSVGCCFCTVCGLGVCCCTQSVDNMSLGVQHVGCLTPC